MPKTFAVASPDPNSPAFDSPAEAADAVSKSFSSTPDSETVAAIFQRPDGKHVYSTTSIHAHENFELHARMPKDWRLSGTVHSHPGDDPAAQWFSPQDLDAAKQANVPGYIRFLKDDSIRQYVPGKTQTQLYSPQGEGHTLTGIRVSRGDPLDSPKQAPTVQDAPAPTPAAQEQPAPAPPPSAGGMLSQAAVEAS